MNKRKWLLTIGSLLGVGVISIAAFVQNAFAYTMWSGESSLSNIIKYGSSLFMDTNGDELTVVNNGAYSALSGQNLYAAEVHDVVYKPDGSNDGQGDWPFLQADVYGQDAHNGYLFIGDSSTGSTNATDWINRLGGNVNYVENYLSQNNYIITLQDTAEFNKTLQYDSFAALVTASGAYFAQGNSQVTPTGQTETYNGTSVPIEKSTYTIYETNPPSANSISISGSSVGVVTQGQNATLTLDSTEHLSGDFTHHYDAVKVVDNSTGTNTWVLGDNTLSDTNPDDMSTMQVESGGSGQNTDTTSFSTSNLDPGSYTAYFFVRDGVDRAAATYAETTFTIQPAPTTGATSGPSITLSANPTSVSAGGSTQLTATASGAPAGDTIQIVDESGDDTLSSGNSYQSASSVSATISASDNNAQTVNYVAHIIGPMNRIVATSNQVSVTFAGAAVQANTTSLNLLANPTIVAVGAPTTITITVPPDSNGGAAPMGEFVQVINPDTGQIVGLGEYTGSPGFTYGFNSSGEYEQYSFPYTSNTVGSQDFEAELWDPGVTPSQNPPNLVSNIVVVTWVQPTVTLSANPTQVFTGQQSQISYTTVGLAANDYVTISGAGGQDMWSETSDTSPSDSWTEVENPANGDTMAVTYTAQLHNSSGAVLSTSTLTVTWVDPTITMGANPQTNVPGQTSTISYSVNAPIPSGFSVDVIPSGNGTNMWNADGITTQTGTQQETESPSLGASITVNYTGEIINNSTQQVIATGTTSVVWNNPWSGTISLSANPQFCATGSNTTLTATTSQAVPSGWSLSITDQSTGQTISTSGSAPESAQYTSYAATVNSFVATLNDGYENIGSPSNTVQVDWNELSLGANPMQLPAGQTTTLTVSDQSIPSGDYLVIYNQTTGQTLGDSQSSPYSVQVSEPTPQTDNFVAYISSNSSMSGSLISSNVVPVAWYGITLTANPSNLPINNTTTLTATAQNLPSGYVLDIYDETTQKEIAIGAANQYTLTATDVKTSPETDTYVARVITPPESGYGLWAAVSQQADWESTDNGFSYNDPSPTPDGTEVFENGQWTPEGNPNGDPDVTSLVYDAQTGDTWAGTASSGAAYWNGMNWVDVGFPPDNDTITSLVYNSASGEIWALTPTGVSYWNGSTWVETSIPTLSGAEPAYLATGPGNEMILVEQNWQAESEIDVWNGSSWSTKYTMTCTSGLGTWGLCGVVYSDGNIYIIEESETTHKGSGSTVKQTFENILGTQFSTLSSTSAWASDNVYWPFDYNSYTGSYYDNLETGGSSGEGNINGTASFIGTGPAGDIYIKVDGWIEGISERGGGLVDAIPGTNGSTPTLAAANGQYGPDWYGYPSDAFYPLPNGVASDGTNTYVGWSGTNYPGDENLDVTENWGQQTSGTPKGQGIGPTANGVSAVGSIAWNSNTGQNAAAARTILQSSSPVSVNWFNPVTAPDNFTLTALPENVVKPANTDFKMVLDSSDQSFVNQVLNGTAQLVIKCEQTWQSVVSENWTPSTDGLSVAIPYTPVPGTSLQYVAELVDPNTGNPVAISNEVTVTDTGNGSLGNSYTTETCGPNGDGTEIFTTYTNGQVTSTKTVPLTMTGLEISGIYHPTEDLQQDLGLTATIRMPITNAEVGNGPIPLRVQAPFAFAIAFPQAQPTTVTATFTVNQHDAVDENGDTSWTVTMQPASNLGFGVWQGATIMPKLPDGDNISIQITATDECGTATTPTGVFPYDNFLVTSDDPEWYYIQPGTGENNTGN